MSIVVRYRGPDGVERVEEFEARAVTVGSGLNCDLTLPDPEVKEEHCVVTAREDGALELTEVGAPGLVLVNGKVQSHGALAAGDEVWIGGSVFAVVPETEDVVSFTEGASTVREEVAASRPESGPDVAEKAAGPVAPGAPDDERFAMVGKVGRLIRLIGSNEDVFEGILDTMFESAPVRRGFIALVRGEGELKVKAQRVRESGATAAEKIEVSRTLVGKVLETGKAVLTSDAETDADFSAARSIHRLRIKAAICVPLVADGNVIGLLYGDNRERPGSLTRDHLSVLAALAGVAALAVEQIRLLAAADQKRRFEQALAIARSIQRSFLPSAPPALEGLEVWGRSDSCDETGGDYYDFFRMGDGSLRVAIGDVTGHGVGPALLMATGRAATRVLMDDEPNLERLMAKLNTHIGADVRDGRFITMFLGQIDPKEGRFRHVGAGHTPPILYRRKKGTTHLVPSKGPPLGIVPGLEYSAGTDLPVASGDVVLFTTDGIMEAANRDREQFGMERLRELVVANAGRSAREIVEAVCEGVDGYCGGRALDDDATLVAVKIL